MGLEQGPESVPLTIGLIANRIDSTEIRSTQGQRSLGYFTTM